MGNNTPNLGVKARVLESLSRYGGYVTSTEADMLALSLASSALPGMTWAFVWRRRGEWHELSYQLPTVTPPPLDKLSEVLRAQPDSLITQRTINSLRFTGPGAVQFPIKPPLPAGRISRYVHRAAIVPYSGGNCILEAYLDLSGGMSDDAPVDLSAVAEILEAFQEHTREQSIKAQDRTAAIVGSTIPEAQLFAAIYHEIKAWLGKSLGAAHLFLYDARDRMLYHRATDSLRIIPEILRNYKPASQASDKALIAFVRKNIDHLEGVSGSSKQELHAMLGKLADEAWIRKNLTQAEHQNVLRSLLSLLPQEPGTGVAGHTALTRIPEISNRQNEKLWSPDAYPIDKWFPLMLSIEQLFGIATKGSMAAVPLLESGQLAGVLFVARAEAFDLAEDTLMLIEKAAQASHLLTLHRTQRFHQRLARSAVSNPSKSIAEIVADEAHHAFNTPLVAHWSFGNRSIESVTLWGIPRRYARYQLIRTYHVEKGEFRDAKMKTRIHELAKGDRVDRVLKILPRPDSDSDHFRWGLPKEILKEREEAANIRLAAGFVVAPPLTKDILIIYTEEPVAVIEANSPQILQKLAAMEAVEQLRTTPKRTQQTPVGESDEFRKVLKEADKAAKAPRIIIYGPSGSGKSYIAEYIFKQSGRTGRLESLGVSQQNPDLFNQEAYGRAEDALGPGTKRLTGKFDNEDGGIIIDDIDVANEQIRGSLLEVLLSGRFTPVGGEVCQRNFQVIATTNRSKKELQQIRFDMLRRLPREIDLPPLSKRRLDIPLLARHFLKERGGVDVRVTADAMCELMNMDFDYDVDGLKRVLEDFVDDGVKLIKKETLPIVPREQEGPVVLKDGTPYFKRWSEEDGPVHLFLTNDVYPPNPNPEEDWVQFPIRSFRVLANRRRKEGKPEIGLYGSVGCGAGLDAIAAARELRPRSMFLTDLRWDVVSVARENALHNSSLRLEDIDRQCGSLFEATPAHLAADVIFENLPIIQGDGEYKGRLTGTYFCQGHEREVPESYRRWTLDSHYMFLTDAKQFLAPEGCVVCSIGARMPWPVVEQMFNDLGYTPELLVYDLKEQEEREEVTGGLSKHERAHDVRFRFFNLDRARQALSSIRPGVNSGDDLALRGFATTRVEADAVLSEHAISAERAHSHEGRIGHMVYIVCGRPRATA